MRVRFGPASGVAAATGACLLLGGRQLLRVQARIGCIENPIVFLLCALGVIAQALHLVGRLRPRAVELDA